MSELKKGLRNPLDEAQVRKAVLALQTFLEKQRASKSNKKELLSDTEYISCIITRKTIPGKTSLKPIQIDLPHSLFSGDNDGDICLFVKDSDKDRIKQALAEDPVPGLAKVMALKKLRKNFKQYEDRRTLADAYDLFLADDRILPYLKTPLGSKFFVKKKQPIAVRVSRANVSASIRAVFNRTAMHVSPGACTNVKIAHFGLSVDEIVANIIVGMNNCAAHIAKGWAGIQSINVKTSESIALPIYNALSELAKLPPVASKKAQLKRKLEEVEATKTPTPVQEEQEETTAPAAKKQKGKDSKPVAKKTEVKKAEVKKAESKKAVTKKAVTKKTVVKKTVVKKTETKKDKSKSKK